VSNGPTPYAELNEVLAGLVTDVRAILGGTLVGAYLQGSFALGDGDMQSDCDFLLRQSIDDRALGFARDRRPRPGSMERGPAFAGHA